MTGPGLVERKLGGAAVELDLAGAYVGGSAIERVTIRRGRYSTDEDPAPAVLTGVLATTRLATLPELGDELRAELTPAALNASGAEATRLRITYTATAAGAYAYVNAGGQTGVTVPTGSVLEYDVLWETADAQLAVDLELSTGTLRDSGAVDQDGYGAHPSTSLPTLTVGEWYRRRIEIPSSIGGGTLNYWSVGGEAESGTHAACFRRVRLLDPEGRLLAQHWRSPEPDPWGGVLYSANANVATELVQPVTYDPAVRFVGHVSEVEARPAPRGGVAELRVTAVGPKARLGRLLISAGPESEQDDGDRVAAYFDRAKGADPALVFGLVDPGAYMLRQRDVQGYASSSLERLLDEAASSAGGTVVEQRTGVVTYKDTNARRNLAPRAALEPGEVILPSSWRQDLRGMVTDLTLVYGYEDANGNRPTVQLDDPVAEARHGRYSTQRTTELRDYGDANTRAHELVGRGSRPSWRIEGLSLELLRTVTPGNLAGLLAVDYGDALDVTGLPTTGPYTSARVFVEGALETTTRHGWSLDLDVSDYGQTGAPPVWADVPGGELARLWSWRKRTYYVGGVRWEDVDEGLSWLGAVGWYVGKSNEGRWLDQPADLRWSSGELGDVTWTNYS